MKKVAITLLSAVAAGILASILRGYELAFGFDFMTNLPTKMGWVVPVLLLVGVAVAVMAFFAAKEKPEPQEAKKSPIFSAAAFAGSAIMAALAAYAVYFNYVVGELVMYLLAAASVLNLIAFAILGAKNIEKNDSPAYSVIAFLPVIWATIAVIMIFRERVSEPIAEHFAFLLFAFLCVLLFTYTQTGYVYGKNRLRAAVVVGTLGTYLSAIELLSPFIASFFNSEYVLMLDFKVVLPLLAYVIYMPAAIIKMMRNENNVE